MSLREMYLGQFEYTCSVWIRSPVPAASAVAVDPHPASGLRLDGEHPDLLTAAQHIADRIARRGQPVQQDGAWIVGVDEAGWASDQAGPHPALVVGRGDHDHRLFGQERGSGRGNFGADHAADAGGDGLLSHPPLHRQLARVIHVHLLGSEESAGGGRPVGRGSALRPVRCVHLEPGSVRVGEEDASGGRSLAVRHDAVVRELRAQRLQRRLDAPHLVDAGCLERKVVQAWCFRGEPTVALLPEGQPQRSARAEEGVPVLALAVDGQRFETQRVAVEGDGAVEVGDVDADVPGVSWGVVVPVMQSS